MAAVRLWLFLGDPGRQGWVLTVPEWRQEGRARVCFLSLRPAGEEGFPQVLEGSATLCQLSIMPLSPV